MKSSERTCPCKHIPLNLSSFSAAEYGDWYSLVQNKVKGKALSGHDSSGNTPLHYAAQHGHVAATKFLLTAGAMVDDAQSGATPLHRASYAGACTTMQLLIDAKASLLTKDTSFRDEMTPLHKSIAGGRYMAVKLLLIALEDQNLVEQALAAQDSLGRTPLALAQELQKDHPNVTRWNDVAGGLPDWSKCLSLLTSHDRTVWKIRAALPTLEWAPSSTTTTTTTTTTNQNEVSNCFECSDMACRTASWASAFQAALRKDQEVREESSRLPLPEPTEVPQPTLTRGNFHSNINEDTVDVIGRSCGACGCYSLVLYPCLMDASLLVCKKCRRKR